MSREYSKEDSIKAKKGAFKKIDSLIEHFINLGEEGLKKACLISNWLATYSDYISFESRFDPRKNISYKRGDVVKINFGFRIGSELGGIHYAVIVDNHNNHSSDSITVIPLGSDKGRDNTRDVRLGSELYKKVQLKYKTLLPKFQKTNQFLNALESALAAEEKDKAEAFSTNDEFDKAIEKLKMDLKKMEKRLELLKQERDRMKSGSIAKVGQITTVSKIRILDPKKTDDVLGGIRLSDEAMECVNSKILELYVFGQKDE